MKLTAHRGIVCLLCGVTCAGLAGGCLNAEDPLIPDTWKLNVATALLPAGDTPGTSGAADASQTMTAAEQNALDTLLGALADGAAGGGPLDLIDGLSGLGDLQQLGITRRDVALLALDALEQQADLTPEQSFAVRLTRALVGREPEALAELIFESLQPLLVDGLSAADAPGTAL